MNETLKQKIQSALDTGWRFLPDAGNGTVSMIHEGAEPVVLLQIVPRNWATIDFAAGLADFINTAAEPVKPVETSEEE